MTMPLSAHLPLPLAAAGEGLDYLEIARNSGPVGIAVLVLLLGASTVCWAIIVRKWLQIRRAQDESVKFLETFWQSKRLDAIYQAAEALRASPISQVFRAGYVELSKVTAQKKEAAAEGGMHDELGGLENVERALKRAAATEVTALEAQVPFLGTTASAAPFVGLFGTVWGIMRAFHDIYRIGNANLATVDITGVKISCIYRSSAILNGQPVVSSATLFINTTFPSESVAITPSAILFSVTERRSFSACNNCSV
jgi:biopolymer transport protein TolQ